MEILADALGPGYVTRAAEALLRLSRGVVLIATGFYVRGAAETDGPPGAWAIAKALQSLGFSPMIVTDDPCRGIFEREEIPVIYEGTDLTAADCDALLDRLEPKALISIERCGINSGGIYANAANKDISQWTAPLSVLFDEASARSILTVGIGDGGNEIGMGKLSALIIDALGVRASQTTTDHLIVATTSNWGGYALAAALEQLSGTRCLPEAEDTGRFLADLVDEGLINALGDGDNYGVDGFPAAVGIDIIRQLRHLIDSERKDS